MQLLNIETCVVLHEVEAVVQSLLVNTINVWRRVYHTTKAAQAGGFRREMFSSYCLINVLFCSKYFSPSLTRRCAKESVYKGLGHQDYDDVINCLFSVHHRRGDRGVRQCILFLDIDLKEFPRRRCSFIGIPVQYAESSLSTTMWVNI